MEVEKCLTCDSTSTSTSGWSQSEEKQQEKKKSKNVSKSEDVSGGVTTWGWVVSSRSLLGGKLQHPFPLKDKRHLGK